MTADRIAEIVALASNRLVCHAELAEFFCLDVGEVAMILRAWA